MTGAKTHEVVRELKAPSPSTAQGSEHASITASNVTASNISRQEFPCSNEEDIPTRGRHDPNVLPHGNDLMDVEYIGGVYDKKIHRSVWEIDSSQKPYLSHIKKVSNGWPHLQWLADYMEVGTSPIKWKALRDDDTKNRAEYTRVAVLEFPESGGPPTRTDIQTSKKLGYRLNESDLKADPKYARLFIIEDMSRDVIEAFGAKYDIDPLYFRSQISDYLWYKTEDPWVELQDLPHIAAERHYYNIRYMRARYFKSEMAIKEGKKKLGKFNVLRRLEEDLSYHVRELKKPTGPTVGVVRSKTALWLRKNKNDEKGVIGILVVDPELETGYPLWGGPRNLQPCPGMGDNVSEREHPQSLFEELCHYAKIMTPEQVRSIAVVPRTLGLPIISLVAAEWMSVVSYIITGLTKIEWELEHPFYRRNSDGLSGLLDRLHPLRRLIPVYRMMICETLNTILNKDSLAVPEADPTIIHLRKLRSDFEAILQSIEQLQTRTQNIISLATTIIGVEENQRAMKMNKNLVRVTYLAVVFAPMAFISSFFSMAPDLGTLKDTFWIYVAVAVPVTVTCLIIADHNRLLKHGKRFLGIENKEKRNGEGSEKK